MSRYVPSVDTSDPSISQEAQSIIDEASAPLRKWMDDSIEKLHKDFTAKIDQAAQDFQKEANAICAEHEKLSKDLTDLVNQLNQIPVSIGSGTDAALLAASKQTAMGLKDYLAQREQKWKGAGAAAVKALWTAKTAMTGIP